MTTYTKEGVITCYRFDEHGFYYEESGAQVLKEGGDYVLHLPPDCVDFAPERKAGFWYQINDDKTAWTAIKKPTTAEECIGLFVEHEDQCHRSHELRKLFEDLCAASGGKYQVVRDEDDLCLTVEAVPEKTAEEIAADVAQDELNDFDSQLSAIKDRLLIAQLTGNTEQIETLKQEYQSLMEA